MAQRVYSGRGLMRLLGFSVAMVLFAAGLCSASANDQQIAQGITNRFKQEQQRLLIMVKQPR
jgi:hypothetical protein